MSDTVMEELPVLSPEERERLLQQARKVFQILTIACSSLIVLAILWVGPMSFVSAIKSTTLEQSARATVVTAEEGCFGLHTYVTYEFYWSGDYYTGPAYSYVNASTFFSLHKPNAVEVVFDPNNPADNTLAYGEHDSAGMSFAFASLSLIGLWLLFLRRFLKQRRRIMEAPGPVGSVAAIEFTS